MVGWLPGGWVGCVPLLGWVEGTHPLFNYPHMALQCPLTATGIVHLVETPDHLG